MSHNFSLYIFLKIISFADEDAIAIFALTNKYWNNYLRKQIAEGKIVVNKMKNILRIYFDNETQAIALFQYHYSSIFYILPIGRTVEHYNSYSWDKKYIDKKLSQFLLLRCKLATCTIYMIKSPTHSQIFFASDTLIDFGCKFLSSLPQNPDIRKMTLNLYPFVKEIK